MQITHPGGITLVAEVLAKNVCVQDFCGVLGCQEGGGYNECDVLCMGCGRVVASWCSDPVLGKSGINDDIWFI